MQSQHGETVSLAKAPVTEAYNQVVNCRETTDHEGKTYIPQQVASG